MPWYAIDAIDDAIDSSRRFLFPFRLGRWLRLAVIVFFLGALSTGGSPPSFGGFDGVGDAPTQPQPTPTPDPAPGVDPGTLGQVALVAVGVIAVLVLLGLLFSLVRDVMHFVFLDALRSDDVRIRGPFRRRFGKGLRLFGFKLVVDAVVGIPIFVGVALVVLAFAVPGLLSEYGVDPGLFVGLGGAGLLAVFALAALLGILFGLLKGLTNTFVTAVMLVEDVGVVEGWRRFWPTLRREWKQYVVYLVARVILGIGVGIVTAIVVAIPGLVILAIAAIAIIAIVSAFGATFSVATVALSGVTLLVAFLALLLVVLPVGIVVQTYFRLYELMVLGHSNPRFALVSLPDDDVDGDENAGDGFDGGGGDGPDGDDRLGSDRPGSDRPGTRSDDESPSRQSTTDETVSSGDADRSERTDEDDSGFSFGGDVR